MIGLNGTSRLLKALADETRLRILNLLAEEELSTSDFTEILNMGQSRVSTHLALLKEVGLVQDRRHGRRHGGTGGFARPAPRRRARVL
jgi:ArsR family transcriptional regulator